MAKRTGRKSTQRRENYQQSSRAEKTTTKQSRGEKQYLEDQVVKKSIGDWDLDWFSPRGMQSEITKSMEDNVFTIVNGPSGSGKSSTAIWKALCGLKGGNYKQLIFIKNPTEVGDDQVGFLSGNITDKLQAHYETTKIIFHDFISPQKLECDLDKNIFLKIPNFVLGATYHKSIVIIEEAQVMSPQTIKLLLERCGMESTYVILGDKQQRYSVTSRADGFSDLIQRATKEYQGKRIPRDRGMVGYIKLSIEDNQRSEGSKYINVMYDES